MVWPTYLYWAIATDVEILPREYLAAVLGFHQLMYSHCSTTGRASCSFYPNKDMVREVR